ncbi:DUF4179 domain-containing protein [Romboutsia lituseburensis]|uniref:DUF4179 domain-containing protein n=1 Tax=Romboutsia lituseburensis TaxID=1537 RepID=UPI00215A14E3|nr:DUF4179 domain-containing protein [Romboutsia lituseburensis]MCR8746993.1 DUF4179 domain-containing protein [Romboutsia lituseburensis]
MKKASHLKSKNKNKFLKFITLIILSICIFACELNYSIAEGTTNLHNFIKGITLNPKEDYSNYTQCINLTETLGNIDITINEIVYDGHKIYFMYMVKFKNMLLRQTNNGFYKDKLDLESSLIIKNGTATEKCNTITGYIDDYTYKAMKPYDLNFKGKKSPNALEANLLVDIIYINESNSNTMYKRSI